MAHSVEPIVAALRAARQDKALSQRALSTKTGLPQSQISKIENATVDLQTSSLIALARALDLEIMLVPRSLVPAVQGILRSRPQQTSKKAVRDFYKQLEKTRRAANRFAARTPQLKELTTLSSALEEVRRLQNSLPTTQIDKILEQTQAPLKAIGEFQKTHDSIEAFRESVDISSRLNEINTLTRQLRAIRNAAVHGKSAEAFPPLPAYRLDEEDGNG